MTGCAQTRPITITEVLGPQPVRSKPWGTNGNLIVYTAMERFDTLDADHEKHTEFKILSPNGQLLMKVRNRSGSFDEDPTPVTLPAGNYRIEAAAANVGTVSLTAVVEARRTTAIYLDGVARPAGGTSRNEELVRLPNGVPIGWRAQLSLESH